MEIKDILGIEPLAETTKIVIESALSGVESFLAMVCKPGLEELGLMARDNVRYWRLKNILSIIEKAKGKLNFDGADLQVQANARVGLNIIDEASIVDDEELQDMWAGLFASSCTEDGKDDSNIIFVDILKRLSVVEARILKYSCEHSQKRLYKNGLIVSDNIKISYEELKHITSIDDVYRLDRELDHLTSLSMLHDGGKLFGVGGFSASDEMLIADITPTALALNLYYKTNTINVSPKEFWKETLKPAEEEKK